MKLIFAVIYTFILGWLCKKGWKGLAWFLVLLPYVMILLMMFGVIKLAKSGINAMNSRAVMMYPTSNSPLQQALNAS